MEEKKIGNKFSSMHIIFNQEFIQPRWLRREHYSVINQMRLSYDSILQNDKFI